MLWEFLGPAMDEAAYRILHNQQAAAQQQAAYAQNVAAHRAQHVKPKGYQGDFEDVEFTEHKRDENADQRRSIDDGRSENPRTLPADNA